MSNELAIRTKSHGAVGPFLDEWITNKSIHWLTGFRVPDFDFASPLRVFGRSGGHEPTAVETESHLFHLGQMPKRVQIATARDIDDLDHSRIAGAHGSKPFAIGAKHGNRRGADRLAGEIYMNNAVLVGSVRLNALEHSTGSSN